MHYRIHGTTVEGGYGVLVHPEPVPRRLVRHEEAGVQGELGLLRLAVEDPSKQNSSLRIYIFFVEIYVTE